jgi:pimeloyl-ACP methyl ester carboxylesterase
MKTLHSLGLLLAGLISAFPTIADELISLRTRAEVTQSVLLWEPHPPSPDTVILLIPGGSGNIGLALVDGRAQAARPHIFSRVREAIIRPQFAIVVVDAPSDQKDMDQEFRMSTKHATDMTAVVHEIRDRFPRARLVIMGHSRGSVSAGYVSRALGDQVNAVVLFSGLYQATQRSPQIPSPGPGLSDLDLRSLRSPVLIVHHAKDACPAAPFAPAQKLSAGLPMITVNGNDETSPASPCGPGSNHLFMGMEKLVAEEVVKWLAGTEWQRTVP